MLDSFLSPDLTLVSEDTEDDLNTAEVEGRRTTSFARAAFVYSVTVSALFAFSAALFLLKRCRRHL